MCIYIYGNIYIGKSIFPIRHVDAQYSIVKILFFIFSFSLATSLIVSYQQARNAKSSFAFLFHLELFLHRRFAILNFIRIKSKTSNRRVLLFIVVVAIFFARGAVSNCCRINRVIPILQSNSTQSFLFFHPPAFVLHSFIPSSSHNLQRCKIGISQLWKQRE